MTLAFCTKQIFYIHLVLYCVLVLLPIPVADGSKTRGCSRSRTGIAGSNPACGVDVVVLYSKEKRQKGRIVRTKKYKERKKNSAWVVGVFVVLQVKSKCKMKDNEDKEPSTDEVQSTREYQKKKKILPWAWMAVPCACVCLSGRGLCVGPITRPGESYRLCV